VLGRGAGVSPLRGGYAPHIKPERVELYSRDRSVYGYTFSLAWVDKVAQLRQLYSGI
jgi:hypothetical protein